MTKPRFADSFGFSLVACLAVLERPSTSVAGIKDQEESANMMWWSASDESEWNALLRKVVRDGGARVNRKFAWRRAFLQKEHHAPT